MILLYIWWILWYNVFWSLGNCDMRLSRYLFSPHCFISSPSCLWYDSKCDLFLNHICPYYYPYTIHTLSCYLKWRSNLKFNTPDFNIHKTETVEAGKVFLPCTKINPWSGFDLSINVKLMPFNLHCHVSWLWATVKHCRFCEALINIFRNGCIINIAIPNKNQVWSS